MGYVVYPKSSQGGFGAFVAELENGWIQENSGWVEGYLFCCKLKCRGCDPDTLTADGKADRNFTRFIPFSAKGLQIWTFRNSGVVTAENGINTAFVKELK